MTEPVSELPPEISQVRVGSDLFLDLGGFPQVGAVFQVTPNGVDRITDSNVGAVFGTAVFKCLVDANGAAWVRVPAQDNPALNPNEFNYHAKEPNGSEYNFDALSTAPIRAPLHPPAGDDGSPMPTVDVGRDISGTISEATPNVQSVAGLPGPGVPAGGLSGQVLAKASNADYDTEWAAGGSGGGGIPSITAVAPLSWNSGTGTLSAPNVVTTTGGVISKSVLPQLNESDITQLTTDLAGKAASSHTHAEADVTGLVAGLSGKSNVGHTHVEGDVGALVSDLANAQSTAASAASAAATANAALPGKANTVHTHNESDVVNLASDLSTLSTNVSSNATAIAGKSQIGHTHSEGDVVNLGTDIANLQSSVAALPDQADNDLRYPRSVNGQTPDPSTGDVSLTPGEVGALPAVLAGSNASSVLFLAAGTPLPSGLPDFTLIARLA